jgi:hypothetical protein
MMPRLVNLTQVCILQQNSVGMKFNLINSILLLYKLRVLNGNN